MKGGIMAGQMTRLLREDIKTRQTKLMWSKSKSLWKTLSLMSNYHPTTGYKTKESKDQITKVTNFINDILAKNEIIIGADLNATIRNRMLSDLEDTKDLINTLLRPHRNPKWNESGEIIRNMMQELDLRADLFWQ